ncbi:MAG: hypothetical protein SGJ17_12720 [Hyphomicrobiales bacterium]|nr:hypothetical protein [Hyphomicrobiales bacterium]
MTFAKMPGAILLLLLALTTAALAPIRAAPINTANESGAYHKNFCPGLEKSLADAKLDFKCAPSDGSIDNISRVLADPRQIGFAQFDIFARETAKRGSAPLTLIRDDIGRECLFMVTRNKTFKTYGEVAALAPYLRFVLPPKGSGATATFEYLQKIDPDGLGKAKKISYAASADDAIDQALSIEDDLVTLFVQFPDPNNARFKVIDENAGQFIPIIDRAILQQEIGGQKIYYAQATEISNPKFLKKGETVITSCTPVTLFTGAPEKIGAGVDRANHEDMIRIVKALDRSLLVPGEGFFASLLKRTKELSTTEIEQALKLSEEARQQSGPLLENLKKNAEDLAKQAIDKAKELRQRAQEDADNKDKKQQ